MHSDATFQTAFCTDYESLLHQCEHARQASAAWRAEMLAAPSPDNINKEVTDELLRLQAKYAKAYAKLQQHNHHCSLCQFVARMSEAQRLFGTSPRALEATPV